MDCYISDNINFYQEDGSGPTSISQNTRFLGTLVDDASLDIPVLELGSLTDLFRIEAGATLTLQNLRLRSVVLPEGPVSPLSFLAASAFAFAAPLSNETTTGTNTTSDTAVNPCSALESQASLTNGVEAPSCSPQLLLQDVVLETKTCSALLAHQELACRLAPSPHFAVSPGSLVVLSYTTPRVRARNVTLTCSSQPLLTPPCVAAVVGSGQQLVVALSTQQVRHRATRSARPLSAA